MFCSSDQTVPHATSKISMPCHLLHSFIHTIYLLTTTCFANSEQSLRTLTRTICQLLPIFLLKLTEITKDTFSIDH